MAGRPFTLRIIRGFGPPFLACGLGPQGVWKRKALRREAEHGDEMEEKVLVREVRMGG